MTKDTTELLYAHYKACGSHEFVLQEQDDKKRYCCKACGAQLAEEPNADVSTTASHPVGSTSPGPTETRKAA